MIIIALLAFILMALLFPNAARALIGIVLAFLCFSIAAGLEPDGASVDDHNKTEWRR